MASNKRNLPQTLALTKTAKSDECYDLPITSDGPTKRYVSSSKIMLIFQEPCLKSSSDVILRLKMMFESTAFVINDHPTENTSGLHVDRLKQQVKSAVDAGVQLIVVNSSFSNLSLNRYYAALAHGLRYITLVIPPIILPSGDWFLSNTYLPLFSAWYMHDFDSNILMSHTRASILEAFQFCPNFNSAMSTAGFFPHNFNDLYQLIFNGELRFCIAKIFRNKEDVKEYFEKSSVKKYYGKSAMLEITAFVITPYSIYAKVELNSQQKEVFDMTEKSYDMPTYPSILKKQSLRSLPEVQGKYYPFLCNRTLRVEACMNYIARTITPESEKFSHSHINLGYIEKAPVHRRNIDAALGAQIEKNGEETKLDYDMYEIDNFYVKRIKDFWFIYLKHLLTVDALFTTCCKLQ